MIHHTMCEVSPAKESELDAFLTGKFKKFWTSSSGVVRYHVYGDKLANKLERFIMVEVGSFRDYDMIIDLDERKVLHDELLTLATNVTSRILEPIAE